MTARALLVSILLSGLLAAEEVAEQEAVEVSADASEEVKTTAGESESSPVDSEYGVPLGPFTLTGNIYQKYRYRRTGSGTDQDIYGYLNLDATYPADDDEGMRPYRKLAFNLQGSYNLDIDSFESAGNASQGSSFVPFLDITNTFSDRFRGFIHSAYGEVEDLWGLESFRVGRQQIYREFGLLFDGAYARTKRWKTVSFDVYGGLPTHQYESSASGDALAGFSVDTKPLQGLTLGTDLYYLRDKSDFVADDENLVYLFRGRYDVNREWSIGGSASWIDTRDRRQVLDVRYNSDDWGLTGNLRVVRQNAVVEFQSSEISPYVFVTGKYAPYYQYQLDLYQPLGEKFGVGGGMNLRHLEDSSDEGLYNHDFRNFYLTLAAKDLWTGSRASVQGDLWDSDQDDIYSVGFELEQKIEDFLRIRVGTSYHLYRIDLFTGNERERDRVYYAKFRWHLTPRLDLDTDYQYERDSMTEYHTVTAGLGLWF